MIFRLFCTLSEKVPNVVYRVALMMKPKVVFVLGGPGAGKGTQCARIVEVGEKKRALLNIENSKFFFIENEHVV